MGNCVICKHSVASGSGCNGIAVPTIVHVVRGGLDLRGDGGGRDGDGDGDGDGAGDGLSPSQHPPRAELSTLPRPLSNPTRLPLPFRTPPPISIHPTLTTPPYPLCMTTPRLSRITHPHHPSPTRRNPTRRLYWRRERIKRIIMRWC